MRGTGFKVAPDGHSLAVIARLLESSAVRVHVDTDHLPESISKAVAANVDAAIGTSTAIGRAATDAAIGSMRIAQTSSNRSCSGCDFRNVDWSGRDMHGVSYVGVDLSGPVPPAGKFPRFRIVWSMEAGRQVIPGRVRSVGVPVA